MGMKVYLNNEKTCLELFFFLLLYVVYKPLINIASCVN